MYNKFFTPPYYNAPNYNAPNVPPHPLSHCLSPVRNPEYTYFWKFPKMLTTVCFPPEVFDVRSPDVALRHPPELVSVPACADHLRTKCTLFSNTGLDEHWPLAGGCSSSYRRRQGGRCRSPHSSALPASGGFAQCAALGDWEGQHANILMSADWHFLKHCNYISWVLRKDYSLESLCWINNDSGSQPGDLNFWNGPSIKWGPVLNESWYYHPQQPQRSVSSHSLGPQFLEWALNSWKRSLP